MKEKMPRTPELVESFLTGLSILVRKANQKEQKQKRSFFPPDNIASTTLALVGTIMKPIEKLSLPFSWSPDIVKKLKWVKIFE